MLRAICTIALPNYCLYNSDFPYYDLEIIRPFVFVLRLMVDFRFSTDTFAGVQANMPQYWSM